MDSSEELKKQNKQLKITNDLLSRQKEDFASISGIISGNLGELGRANDARNAALASARKLRVISDKLLANSTEDSDISEEELKKLIKKAKEEKDLLKSKKDNLEISDSELNSLNDIVNQGEELIKVANERLLREEAITNEAGIFAASLSGIEGLLKKAGFGDLAKKLNIKEALKDATELDGTGTKATFSLSKGFSNIGKNILKSLKPTDLLLAGFTKLFQAAKKADENVANLRRNFGVSAKEGIKLNNAFAGAAIRSGDVTANVESLTEANQNINNQLGIQTQYNEELLVAANALVKRNKLSAEAAAGFSQQVLATGISAENLLNVSAQTVAEIQNQTGVQLSFNSVLEGANKISGQLRVNLARTPDGLVKAVATAKTLGVEMDSIAGIAGQLLDFESSITKELEAELLLGRDLNLEQARLLALNGKSDEAVASLVSQVGTLADFQKLNVIQQEALASAVGMTADQLATTVEKQAAINSQKKEGLSIDAESMKEGASALSIQERLASAVEKLNSVLQATAIIVGAIVGAVALVLAPFTGGTSLIGLKAAAVIGGLGGAIGGAALMAEGGMVTGPTRAIVGEAGPEAVIPLNDNTPLIKQANETNKLLRQIATKQGTVNIDSTRAGTAFAMGTYQVQ